MLGQAGKEEAKPPAPRQHRPCRTTTSAHMAPPPPPKAQSERRRRPGARWAPRRRLELMKMGFTGRLGKDETGVSTRGSQKTRWGRLASRPIGLSRKQIAQIALRRSSAEGRQRCC